METEKEMNASPEKEKNTEQSDSSLFTLPSSLSYLKDYHH